MGTGEFDNLKTFWYNILMINIIITNSIKERCCMCDKLTNGWEIKNDVALCEGCACIHFHCDIPTKKEWLAKVRKLHPKASWQN